MKETPYETVSSFFQIEHLHGLLRRVDNSSMLCGIEARVPFVDHRLVERLYAVDYNWNNAQGISKAPLRKSSSSNLCR
jgi:asparagine synthase (glutamine-hydrolysing)